jgi:5'-nucleotidase (lipoprotein e(P4) family)
MRIHKLVSRVVRCAVAALVLPPLAGAGLAAAQAPCNYAPPAEATRLEVKWVRDSAEYVTLFRQVYRQATAAVRAGAERRGSARDWAIVMDIDETALDNSVYQLERAAYGKPFDDVSWNAFVRRKESPAVPGVVDFVNAVRAAGGRVTWISGRDDATREETKQNLAHVGLWHDEDRLCLQTEKAYTKAVRRREVSTGTGACAWPGHPVEVVAYVGDQVGDFPAAGEDLPDAGRDEAFGTRFFLLPDPMYGSWATRVTRDK